MFLLLLPALLACTPDESPPATPTPAPATEPVTATPVPADPPAQPGASSPRLVSDGGTVLGAWVEPHDDGHRLVTATWQDGAWSAAEVVDQGPQVLATWADRPALAVGGDGRPVLAWLEGDAAHPGATTVVAWRREATGWERLGPVHHDGVPAEHGFTAAAPEGDGVRLTWLDGRQTPDGGPTQLRSALVGQQPGPDALGPEQVVDDRVCDCCGVDAAGVLLAWRDRDEDEIRDVRLRIGSTTTTLVDGWKVPGCPVNGPAVARWGQGAAVAWYTEAPEPVVKLAFGPTGSAAFGEPVRVDQGQPTGRVALALLGTQAVVAWVEADALWLRRVSVSGAVGEPLRLGDVVSRSFPSLTTTRDGLLVSWQAPGGPPTLRARHLGIDALAAPGTAQALPLATSTLETTDQAEPSDFPSTYSPTDLDGQPTPLSTWAGQPVLLNLWATWCPPCMRELPILVDLHARWSDRGVTFLGIAVDDQAPRIRATSKSRGMAWTLLQGTGQGTWDAFGTDTLPTTRVYDRRGHMIYEHSGALVQGDPALATALEKALSD